MSDAFACPKCGAMSGGDWSQCGGSCPMPMSPHHDRHESPMLRAHALMKKLDLTLNEDHRRIDTIDLIYAELDRWLLAGDMLPATCFLALVLTKMDTWPLSVFYRALIETRPWRNDELLKSSRDALKEAVITRVVNVETLSWLRNL